MNIILFYFYLQSIIRQVFCNPLSDRLAETNFYRFSLRAHVHMRSRMCRYRTFTRFRAFDGRTQTGPRVQLTKHNASTDADAWHSRAGRNSKPRNARRGTGAAVFFHGATNSALAASRISLTTALAEPLGETDREFDPFFFLFARARRTNVSFCETAILPIGASFTIYF